MLALTLLACLQFPDTDAPTTQDSDTGSSSGDCSGGFQTGDSSRVFVNAYAVDGLSSYGYARALCVSADGTDAEMSFYVDGDLVHLSVSAPGVGSYNLPDGSVSVSVSNGSASWNSEDVFAGTYTVSADGELAADLQLEASNPLGINLVLGVSWSGEPASAF